MIPIRIFNRTKIILFCLQKHEKGLQGTFFELPYIDFNRLLFQVTRHQQNPDLHPSIKTNVANKVANKIHIDIPAIKQVKQKSLCLTRDPSCSRPLALSVGFVRTR